MSSNQKTMHDFTHPRFIETIKKPNSISELVEFIAKYEDKIALETSDTQYSYNKLLEDVAYSRGYFIEKQYNKGTHIGIVLENDYDFVRLFLAITSLGMVAVIISPNNYSTIDKIVSKNDIETLIISPKLSKQKSLGIPCFYSSEVIGKEKQDAITITDVNTPASILFSSGTSSGFQNSVLLSHKNISTGVYFGIMGLDKDMEFVYFNILPFYHVFGLLRSLLTPLLMGSKVFLPGDMKNMIRDLQQAKPNIMILVPELANMVANLALAKGKEFIGGNLQYVIAGGAYVTPKIIEKYKRLNIRIFPGYGLTETSLFVTGNPIAFSNPTSVGLPFDGVELKVVNHELYIKGDNVMLGYYNDLEANEKAFDDGFFKTGDLVKITEDGYIYIIGRNDNKIVLTNGENVSPEYLEGLLGESQLIETSLVYKSIDLNGVEALKCEIFPNLFVVSTLSEKDQLQELLYAEVEKVNKKVPSFMKINIIEIRKEDFPRNATMKIIRKR